MSTLSMASLYVKEVRAKARWQNLVEPLQLPYNIENIHPSIRDVYVSVCVGTAEGAKTLGTGLSATHTPPTFAMRRFRLLDAIFSAFNGYAYIVPTFSPLTEYTYRLNKDHQPDGYGSRSYTARKHYPDLCANSLWYDLDVKKVNEDGSLGGKMRWNDKVQAFFDEVKTDWNKSGQCTWGWFNSENGLRIIQPTIQKVSPDRYEKLNIDFYLSIEPILKPLLNGNDRFRFKFDDCSPWNHLFSLGNIIKKGKTLRQKECSI